LVDVQHPIADLHLGTTLDVTNPYRVASSHQPLSTLAQSSTVTPGVSIGWLE
jgi:hypothetical protein